MKAYLLHLLGVQAIYLHAYAKHHDTGTPKNGMEVMYEWSCIDFEWPSERARERAIEHNQYQCINVSAFEFNQYGNRNFLTTPRMKTGIPATLSTISDKKRHGQYLLSPFPSWKDNELGNCDGLTSVYFTKIDEFGRLFALDSGAIDVFAKVPDKVCPPKMMVFDLTAGDKVLGSYEIPADLLDCNSLVFDFSTDIRHGKNDVVVYIADMYGLHLIVGDLRRKKWHRVTHNTFLPNPFYADFYIAGTRVYFPEGIFSTALGPLCDGDRRLYYHAHASLQECYVMTSTIRDDAYVTNERAYPDSFYCYYHNRSSQSAPEAIDGNGVMYFEQETLNAVSCWNTETDYYMTNTAIVARNDTTMQAIRAIKLVGDVLYAVSNRFQLYYLNLLNDTEVNFRVLRAKTADLIRGTPCTVPCPQHEPTCDSCYD